MKTKQRQSRANLEARHLGMKQKSQFTMIRQKKDGEKIPTIKYYWLTREKLNINSKEKTKQNYLVLWQIADNQFIYHLIC